MLIGAILVVCLVLLVLAFVAPRLSHHPQRGVDKTLSAGQQAGGVLPGFLGRCAQKNEALVKAVFAELDATDGADFQ